ncbi:hypothetical protein GpartN1_g6955.t1 [Galdieria partita]|uniref:MARVEL domain-containing protein n=1 Tax=Galdieria partita TaxID=83374 RepID=A0A9C7Q2J2_9RHOD|nr:hypothetical protein GpartN1_g6955.t1 [Galdieria partita]
MPAIRTQVKTALPDLQTWLFYSTKLCFYVITFIFSVVVDALVSNAEFNIYDKSYPHISGDFCAYKASTVSPAGVTAICKYLIAVGAIGLVVSLGFIAFSLWTLFANRIQKLWVIEALLNLFWMVWWFIAAGVETSARPSTGILDSANNRSAINGVEAVSWVNSVLFLFNAILCFAVYWSAETGFWIPTVDDYHHAIAFEEMNEKLTEQRKLDQERSDDWNNHKPVEKVSTTD